jgi:hypothetical protein
MWANLILCLPPVECLLTDLSLPDHFAAGTPISICFNTLQSVPYKIASSLRKNLLQFLAETNIATGSEIQGLISNYNDTKGIYSLYEGTH